MPRATPEKFAEREEKLLLRSRSVKFFTSEQLLHIVEVLNDGPNMDCRKLLDQDHLDEISRRRYELRTPSGSPDRRSYVSMFLSDHALLLRCTPKASLARS